MPFNWATRTLERRLDIDKIDRGWIDWSIAEFAKVPPRIGFSAPERCVAEVRRFLQSFPDAA